MLKFLQLAFRNVFRNRRRTIMTLLMVGGGVAGLLLVGGFFAFMFRGLRESTIRNGLGHIQIFNAEHFRRDEVHVLDTGISDWQHVASNVRSADHVRGVAPRIEFYGMLSNGVKSSVFMGSAVDPDAERAMSFSPRLASGRDLAQSSSGEAEALVGTGVARSMSVKVGDGLTILAVTADGALNGIDVQIVGIANTGFKDLDDRYLRITLPSAQRLLQSDRVVEDLARAGGRTALGAVAAEHRRGLRREADVAHHGDPGADDRARPVGGRAAALELDAVAAGLLDEAVRGLDRLRVRGLIGAEREIADEQRRLQAAADGAREHQHLLDADRHRVRVAEHVVGGRVAHEDDVDARLLGDERARVVVGGDHHDRLAQGPHLRELGEGHALALLILRGAGHLAPLNG